MSEVTEHPSGHAQRETVHVPAPTPWPIVSAFGISLALGGILLGVYISVLGLVLVLVSCIGWFREVLPHENMEHVPVRLQPVEVSVQGRTVRHLELSGFKHPPGTRMSRTPLAAGFKGGIFGGVAMAFIVLIYGQVTHGSVWYGVNLLGGAGVGMWTHPTTAQIATFNWQALGIALALHAGASTLMGLIYGAVLPMLPSRPIVLGGVFAPLAWSALTYGALGLIDPTLNARVSWPWFIGSQIAYGVVAGWVVAHDENYTRTRQLPFAVRIGLEASGLTDEEEDHSQQGGNR